MTVCDDFISELKAMYEAVFFYSDLSSDFMLVPHTFINLTGEKISICKKIWKVDPLPPYWKARRPWGEVDPCFDGFGANF